MDSIGDKLNFKIEDHKKKFSKFGSAPKSLNMDMLKQYIGYHTLTSDFNISDSSILDIGCGFGDLNSYFKLAEINNYNYLGMDMVDDFVNEGTQRYGTDKIKFEVGQFLEMDLQKSYDYIVGSSIFCNKIAGIDVYEYIQAVVTKAFEHSNKGIAFNFLSDRAELQYDHNFYANAEKLLTFMYTLSKNIIFKNDFSPFEFALVVYKDNSLNVRPTYFKSFQERLPKLFCEETDQRSGGIYE